MVTAWYIILIIVVFALFLYLLVALLKPDLFP